MITKRLQILLNKTITIKGSKIAKSGSTNVNVSKDDSNGANGLKIELGENLSELKK